MEAVCKEGLHQSTQKGMEKEKSRRCGSVAAVQPFICEVCHRTFRRRQDIARHKCQRSRDVREQKILMLLTPLNWFVIHVAGPFEGDKILQGTNVRQYVNTQHSDFSLRNQYA